MSAELRFTGNQYEELRDHLLSDRDEHAALLICGTGRAERDLLLCHRVVLLDNTDMEPSSGRLHLDISPLALARIAKQAASIGCTVVVCHSHPFPGTVRASKIDLVTERELCGRVLPGRLAGQPAGALILGPAGYDGRLWTAGSAQPLTVVVAGREVQRTVRRDVASISEQDLRHLGVWGEVGQQRLRRARVGVVGAGGTGSHVVVQLAHLGIGSLLLVDPDGVEATNLNRLIGATQADIGRTKVETLAAAARAIRPELVVETIAASVLEIELTAFVECDVIVCCTDGHGSRALLTELAAQYLVPLIDLGVEVQPAHGSTRAGGGVRVTRPGDPCLHCMGVLDPALIREEFLTDTQRDAERARGYLRGDADPAPSVVAVNGVVASLAVIEVIQQLLDLFVVETQRLLYHAEARALTTARSDSDPGCFVCGSESIVGLGSARPLARRQRETAVSHARPAIVTDASGVN